MFKKSNFDIDKANEFLKRSIEEVADMGKFEFALEIAKQVQSEKIYKSDCIIRPPTLT